MSKIKSLRYFYWLILCCVSLPAHAVLDIEISGAGEHQIPIAVVPFAGEKKLTQSISSIVAADLARSGLFKLVKPTDKLPYAPQEVVYSDWLGTDALSLGKVEVKPSGRITVKFSLLDTVRQSELIGQTVSGKGTELREIAHRIADLIFEKLTGDPSVFNTHIVYVNRQGAANKLVVADSDGYGEKTFFSANSNIMSPAWSPDGSYLAYVVFEQDHAVVYVQSMLTRQRIAVADFAESDSAPAWSPDGQQLAFVLTKDGSSNIYLVQPDGSELQQITYGDQIDTEPHFSPDGQHLIFASDRGGSVQIYQVSVDGGEAERLTFEGGNNYSPHYSPDGKSFVYSSWRDGKFYIVTEDFQTKQVTVLTSGGWERNPTFAPNGKLILFATEENGHGVLATISVDGRVKQKMSTQTGEIFDPMWGPQSKQ